MRMTDNTPSPQPDTGPLAASVRTKERREEGMMGRKQASFRTALAGSLFVVLSLLIGFSNHPPITRTIGVVTTSGPSGDLVINESDYD
jgi:hypothetical protein